MRRGAPLIKPTIGGSFITPTVAWYDASNAGSIHATGGLVDQWDDLSGNAHHATALLALRPVTGANTINGLNVVTFAVGNSMNPGIATLAQPVTIFAVVKATSTAADARIFGTGSVVFGIDFGGNGKWTIYTGGVLAGGTPDTNAHVFDAIFNGASSSIQVDQAATVSGNAGTGVLNGVAFGSTTGGSNSWLGYIAEVLVYSTALSPTDRLAQQAYLKAKWGTP